MERSSRAGYCGGGGGAIRGKTHHRLEEPLKGREGGMVRRPCILRRALNCVIILV